MRLYWRGRGVRSAVDPFAARRSSAYHFSHVDLRVWGEFSCGSGDGDATNTCRLHQPGLSRFLAKTAISVGREQFAESLNPHERRTRPWRTPVSRRRAK
jgi:hypothetical protein